MNRRGFWRGLQTLLLCGLCVSPFWFMASEVNKDEFTKTGMGAALAGIAAVFVRAVHREEK